MRIYPQFILWTYVLLPAISLLLSPTIILGIVKAQQQTAKLMANAINARAKTAAAIARNQAKIQQRRLTPNSRFSSGMSQQPFRLRTIRDVEMPIPMDTSGGNTNTFERKSNWDQQEEALGQLQNMWNMNNFGNRNGGGVLRGAQTEEVDVLQMQHFEPKTAEAEAYHKPKQHHKKKGGNYHGNYHPRANEDNERRADIEDPFLQSVSEMPHFEQKSAEADPHHKAKYQKKKYQGHYHPRTSEDGEPIVNMDDSFLQSSGEVVRSPRIYSDRERGGDPYTGAFFGRNVFDDVVSLGTFFNNEPIQSEMEPPAERLASPEPTLKKKKKFGKKMEPNYYYYPQNYPPQNYYSSYYASPPYARTSNADPQFEAPQRLESEGGINEQFKPPAERLANPEPTLKKKKKFGKKMEPNYYYYPQQNYYSSYYAPPYGRSNVEHSEFEPREMPEAEGEMMSAHPPTEFMEARAVDPRTQQHHSETNKEGHPDDHYHSPPYNENEGATNQQIPEDMHPNPPHLIDDHNQPSQPTANVTESPRRSTHTAHNHNHSEDVGCELDDDIFKKKPDGSGLYNAFDPYPYYQRAVDEVSELNKKIASAGKSIFPSFTTNPNNTNVWPSSTVHQDKKPDVPEAQPEVNYVNNSDEDLEKDESGNRDENNVGAIQPTSMDLPLIPSHANFADPKSAHPTPFNAKAASPNPDPHLHSHGYTHTHTHFHSLEKTKGLHTAPVHYVSPHTYAKPHGLSNNAHAYANAQTYNHGSIQNSYSNAHSKSISQGHGFEQPSAHAAAQAIAASGVSKTGFGHPVSQAGNFNSGAFDQSGAQAAAAANAGAQQFHSGGFGQSGTHAANAESHQFDSGVTDQSRAQAAAAANAGAQQFHSGGFGQSGNHAAAAANAGTHQFDAGVTDQSRAQAAAAANAGAQRFHSGGFGQSGNHAAAAANAETHQFDSGVNGGSFGEPSAQAYSQAAGQAFNGGFGQSSSQAAAQSSSGVHGGQQFFQVLGPSNFISARSGEETFHRPTKEDGFVMPNIEEISPRELMHDMEAEIDRFPRSKDSGHDMFGGLNLASDIVNFSLDKNSPIHQNRDQIPDDSSVDTQKTMGLVTDIVGSSLKAEKEMNQNNDDAAFKPATKRGQKNEPLNNNNEEVEDFGEVDSLKSSRDDTFQGMASITDIVNKGLRTRRQIVDNNNNNNDTVNNDNQTQRDITEHDVNQEVSDRNLNRTINQEVYDGKIIGKQEPDDVLQAGKKSKEETEDQQTHTHKPSKKKTLEDIITADNLGEIVGDSEIINATKDGFDTSTNNTDAGSKKQAKAMIDPDELYKPEIITIEPWASNWDYVNNREKFPHEMEPTNKSERLEPNEHAEKLDGVTVLHKDIEKGKTEDVPSRAAEQNSNVQLQNEAANEEPATNIVSPHTLHEKDGVESTSSQLQGNAENEKHLAIINQNDGIVGDQIAQQPSNVNKGKHTSKFDKLANELIENNARIHEETLARNESKDDSKSDESSEEHGDLNNNSSSTECILPHVIFPTEAIQNISTLTLDEIEDIQFSIPDDVEMKNSTSEPENKNVNHTTTDSFLDDDNGIRSKDDDISGGDLNKTEGDKKVQDFQQVPKVPLLENSQNKSKSLFNISGGPFDSIEAEMGALTEEEKDAFIKQEMELIAEVIKETLKRSDYWEKDQLQSNKTEETKEKPANQEVLSSPNLFRSFEQERERTEFVRNGRAASPTDQQFDAILGTQKEKVENIQKEATDDGDLLMISFIGDSVIKDLEDRRNKAVQTGIIEGKDNTPLENASKRPKRTLMGFNPNRVPITRLISDPTTKIDVPKTLENVGAVVRHTFENPRAPMYHVRNMLGNTKNTLMAAAKVPPNNIIIPSQYEIAKVSGMKDENQILGDINQQMLISRSGRAGKQGPKQAEPAAEDSLGVMDTFQKIGGIVKESVDNGKNVVVHLNDAATDARNVLYTAKHAAPRLIVPGQAPVISSRTSSSNIKPLGKKAILLTPRMLDVQENIVGAKEQIPEQFIGMGNILDAVGLTQPNQPEVEVEKIILEPSAIDVMKQWDRPKVLRSSSAVRTWMKDNLKQGKTKRKNSLDVQKDNVKEMLGSLREAEKSTGTTSLMEFIGKMHQEMKQVLKTQQKERKRQRQEKYNVSKRKPHVKKDYKLLKKKPKRKTVVPIEEPIQKPDAIIGMKNPTKINYDKIIDENMDATLPPEILRIFTGNSPDSRTIHTRSHDIDTEDVGPLSVPNTTKTSEKELNNLNATENEEVGLYLMPELMKPFMGQPSEDVLNNFMRENGEDISSERKSSEDSTKHIAKPTIYPITPLNLNITIPANGQIDLFNLSSLLPNPPLVKAKTPSKISRKDLNDDNNKNLTHSDSSISKETDQKLNPVDYEPSIKMAVPTEPPPNLSPDTLVGSPKAKINYRNLIDEEAAKLPPEVLKVFTDDIPGFNIDSENTNNNLSISPKNVDDGNINKRRNGSSIPASIVNEENEEIGSVYQHPNPFSETHHRDDLGHVLGAINPMMFERYFNESLRIKPSGSNTSNHETESIVGSTIGLVSGNLNETQGNESELADFVQSARQASEETLSDQNQENVPNAKPLEQIEESKEQVNIDQTNTTGRTSMKILDQFQKPFMGYMSHDRINDFLHQYNTDLPDDEEPQELMPQQVNANPVNNVVFSEEDEDYNSIM